MFKSNDFELKKKKVLVCLYLKFFFNNEEKILEIYKIVVLIYRVLIKIKEFL